MVEKLSITIPESVTIGNVGSISFYEFIRFLCSRDQRFLGSANRVRMGVKIESLFKDKEPGSIVDVEQSDFNLLLKVATEPACGYPRLDIIRQNGQRDTVLTDRAIMVYVEAIENAEVAEVAEVEQIENNGGDV
jgi:hypothetical protein